MRILATQNDVMTPLINVIIIIIIIIIIKQTRWYPWGIQWLVSTHQQTGALHLDPKDSIWRGGWGYFLAAADPKLLSFPWEVPIREERGYFWLSKHKVFFGFWAQILNSQPKSFITDVCAD